MHRTPNNAQNTQQKLGVAFSYLERSNSITHPTMVAREKNAALLTYWAVLISRTVNYIYILAS